MSSIRQPVDPDRSHITGRNGSFQIAEIAIFDTGSSGTMIDGIGMRGSAINGGLTVDTRSFIAAAKAYLEGHGYTILKAVKRVPQTE